MRRFRHVAAGDARIASSRLAERNIRIGADITLAREHFDHFSRGIGVYAVQLAQIIDIGCDLVFAHAEAGAGRIHRRLDFAEGFRPFLGNSRRFNESADYQHHGGGYQRGRRNQRS